MDSSDRLSRQRPVSACNLSEDPSDGLLVEAFS